MLGTASISGEALITGGTVETTGSGGSSGGSSSGGKTVLETALNAQILDSRGKATETLSGSGLSGSEKMTLNLKEGDKGSLSEEARRSVGNRPLIQLTLKLGGKQVDWKNPSASVTVSIPYEPSATELAHPETIVIWYVDGSGNPVCVPNGRYDAKTGTVIFQTTHFSTYAVVYHSMNYEDVASGAWYQEAVSFIAARGITGGTGNGKFSPNNKLTRGQFMVMLMKAYGLEPDIGVTAGTDNFADAGNTYYTGYLAADDLTAGRQLFTTPGF